jgi:hypothetical protein
VRASFSRVWLKPSVSDAPVSGSGCMSGRTSMMLEEVIKLHRFAGISPEQSFREAGRHCEAVVARRLEYGHPLFGR